MSYIIIAIYFTVKIFYCIGAKYSSFTDLVVSIFFFITDFAQREMEGVPCSFFFLLFSAAGPCPHSGTADQWPVSHSLFLIIWSNFKLF